MFASNINSSFLMHQSSPLRGEISVYGSKNATLVIMASLLLTRGVSCLRNVPFSADIQSMIQLLEELGATVIPFPAEHRIEVDTRNASGWKVHPETMKRMRASIFVMGPLLARCGKAEVAMPGGDVIGSRPIDLHLKWLAAMGAEVRQENHFIRIKASSNSLRPVRAILDYPSVGATENIMMAASLTPGITEIVNAALEPQVLDLIKVLQKMGAQITVQAPARIVIEGVSLLEPIDYEIMPDWIETGTILAAVAATGGSVSITNGIASDMEVFLLKLSEMGHTVVVGKSGIGIDFTATLYPQAVSFKTGPYPSFPTDLQAPFMVLQCLAQGKSVIEETVFENRLLHARELQKMGAVISIEGTRATIIGVDQLYGVQVVATDIRAASALVIAGIAAHGTTIMSGVHHWLRGYERLENRLKLLGASIISVDHENNELIECRVSTDFGQIQQ